MIKTFCHYHIGDNLWQIHFMRKCVARDPSLQFTHACSEPYLVQLREVVADLPQIKLVGLGDKPDGAVDTWKNRDGKFYESQKRDDWVGYHLEFFDKLSRDLGIETPLEEASDFLFDYQALAENDCEIDFLIVNSQPLSSQFPAYDPPQFDNLLHLLRDNYGFRCMTTAANKRDIPTTHPRTITGIGRIKAKYIFGVATGPVWPTWNIYREPEFRVVLSDRERIDISPRTDHANTIERGIGALYERGIL